MGHTHPKAGHARITHCNKRGNIVQIEEWRPRQNANKSGFNQEYQDHKRDTNALFGSLRPNGLDTAPGHNAPYSETKNAATSAKVNGVKIECSLQSTSHHNAPDSEYPILSRHWPAFSGVAA